MNYRNSSICKYGLNVKTASCDKTGRISTVPCGSDVVLSAVAFVSNQFEINVTQ